MNLPTAIVFSLVLAVICAVIFKLYKDKKAGKGCSCGKCQGCENGSCGNT